MHLESLQSYVLLDPTALVIEDREERIVVYSSTGSVEARKKAVDALHAALGELREAVDPYEAYLNEQASADDQREPAGGS